MSAPTSGPAPGGPVPGDPCDAGPALADVATVGPFFELPVVGDGDGWTPFARLHDDPAPLSERIALVGASLGSDERVAASIAFQGMVARLVSAPLATVALHAVLPDLSTLSRDPGGDDPWAPALAPSAGASREATRGSRPGTSWGTRTADPGRDPDRAAGPLGAALVEGQLEPLIGAVRSLVPVSGRVLWGNVSSALAGSARVLDVMRPQSRPTVIAVLAALLTHPALDGTGRLIRLDPDDPATEWGFRRRSCCLYYRVPGGGTCGDCVLTAPRPGR